MALEKAGAPTEKLWEYILGDTVVTAETAENLIRRIERLYLQTIYTFLITRWRIRRDAKKPGFLSWTCLLGLAPERECTINAGWTHWQRRFLQTTIGRGVRSRLADSFQLKDPGQNTGGGGGAH